MPAAYPLGLSTILRASKSRSQPAAFSLREPRRGYGYAQETGTDVPVFWDVEFRFSRSDAVRFQLWFVATVRRGVDEFTMPIRTEFGLIEHVCRFMPESLLPCREDGETFGYTSTIMARAQVIPPAYLEAAEVIAGLPDWEAWTGLLDEAMTSAMPEA